MRLYNLFPLLAGPFENWPLHVMRAAEMGFRSWAAPAGHCQSNFLGRLWLW